MGKTVVIQGHKEGVARLLTAKGYKVVDPYEAHHHRMAVDAYLYTTYHPDAFTSYQNTADSPDSLSDGSTEAFGIPASFALNISSMSPEQVADILDRRLHQHPPTL